MQDSSGPKYQGRWEQQGGVITHGDKRTVTGEKKLELTFNFIKDSQR